MKVIGFALIASLSFSTSAFANSSYFVTLAQPVVGVVDVVAGMTSFRCENSSCISVSEPYDASNVRTCRQIAHKVGEVTSYRSVGYALNAEALASCNQKD